ncbi:hypothetical protein LWI28_019976 [Acer negundo]|uniref:Uncharacterized protein n=1 Tax=Acer negundo TaxID=4023 RepID=A0AAD5IN96_ACENE|nr:hypothetical protein LWI28_019976 [Acer negundo]
MNEIKQTSLEAHAYLNEIPLETWAAYAFDTICKTDHNINNVVEAFNGWMNKHRTLPMLTMMETVRKKFMKRILSRYEAAKAAYLRTYSNNIHAIPDGNLWPNGNFETVLPPIRRRGAGRQGYLKTKNQMNQKGCKGQLVLDAGFGGSSSTYPGAASTNAELDSTHPRHASTHAGHATRTSLGGSSIIVASPRISGTVTRVI